MRISFELVDTFALVAVTACWILFVLPFVFRRRPPRGTRTARGPATVIGIIVQATAFSIVWAFRRPLGEPMLPAASPWLGVALDVVAIVLGASAVRLALASTIPVEKPSLLLRHPIDGALGALLVATGLVTSRWLAVLGAVAVFAVGTCVRLFLSRNSHNVS